ncbi:MAG: hypothetical protein J6Y10_03400 [Lachnospiraceae bacterium]|nr:hypothetical protein [Lachnospiraceae bacterium]
MRSQFRKDNRGIALISVMICATLCLLLSATILRVSLLSYRQKAISKQAASTFYENEAIVDDIKMGLQAKVATAFAVSSTTSRANFVTNFKASLLSDGGAVGSDKDKIEKALKSYLTGYDPDSTIKDISVTVEGYSDGGTIKYFDESVAGEIVIRNVRIRYTDLERGGYVSEVKTDIRIRSPYVSESTSSSGGYSMFAGSGFSVTGDGAKATAQLDIIGDIYIGYDPSTEVLSGGKVVNALAMDCGRATSVYWTEESSITINGDIRIDNRSNLVILSKNVDVRGTIYVSKNSNLIIAKGAKVKCKDIVVETTITEELSPGSYYTWHDNWNGGDLMTEPTIQSWEGSRYTKILHGTATIVYSGKSLSSNYNSGNADVINHLPVGWDTQDINDPHLYNNQGNKSGLFVWDGTKATRVNKVTNKTVSSLPGLTLDSSNYAHPRVKKTIDGVDYYFDEEYVGLIDVDYFVRYVKKCPEAFEPKKQMTTDQFRVNGAKYKANDGVTLGSINQGGATRHQDYNCGPGKTVDVEVMVGKVQTMNRSDSNGQVKNCHFAIGMEDVPLCANDNNGGAQSVGIYITPGKMTCAARELCSSIRSLTDMATNKSYAQAFFDSLGRQLMGQSSLGIDAQTINNFFVGGIKVFYEDSQGGSGGSGQSVTATDKEMNATLDIITFENWEKNPAVS